jgi:hypothetical protein
MLSFLTQVQHSRISRIIGVCLFQSAVVILAVAAPRESISRHWAFAAPIRPDLPKVNNALWPRNNIDRFVLSRLEGEKMQPSSEAGRRTLLRRLSLDLIGLPPSLNEIDDFLNDRSPAAYEKVVDRLLASPHFGEKWARWWMDLAHYGDSDGYLTDQLRPVAWRWRQWVVDALNRGMPFDQFSIEQIAGDLIPNATTEQRMATGFFRNTLSNREGGADLEEFRNLQVVDRTGTFGITWLGVTFACAQCHDHKYDPISQKEFFSLYAFFNNADELNIAAPLPGEQLPDSTRKFYDERRKAVLFPIAVEVEALQKKWEAKLLATEACPAVDHLWDRQLELLGLVWGGNLGEGQLEGLNIVDTPWDQRTPDQRDRLQDYFLRSGSVIDEERFKELKVSDVVEQLDKLAAGLPTVTRAPAMVRHHVSRETHVHVRGNFRDKGGAVEPGTPAALHPMHGSGDRMALARWVVSPDNPLTARVTVNRLWQELFGRGLVATSDDFGTRGEKPSHPELLDWLATEFVRQHWDVKAMLNLMVSSAAYRQASTATREMLASDPENNFLGRHSRQRLSAELVRDNLLAASGLLERGIGGPSVRPPQPESVTKEGFENRWEISTGGDRYRRGLYTFIQRTTPYAQFATFDLPDNNTTCTHRERSNTPLQALNLLNDPAFFGAAQALGARVLRESGDPLDRAYLLCLGRLPRSVERQRLEQYLAKQIGLLKEDSDSAKAMAGEPVAGIDTIEQAAWTGVASVILNLDEFITVE